MSFTLVELAAYGFAEFVRISKPVVIATHTIAPRGELALDSVLVRSLARTDPLLPMKKFP